jgi:hypothetical protein
MDRVYNTSKYLGTAALDLAPATAPWRIRVSANWVGHTLPSIARERCSADTDWRTSAAWTFRALEADIGVRNVFDRAYPMAGEVVSPGQPRTTASPPRASIGVRSSGLRGGPYIRA